MLNTITTGSFLETSSFIYDAFLNCIPKRKELRISACTFIHSFCFYFFSFFLQNCNIALAIRLASLACVKFKYAVLVKLFELPAKLTVYIN